MTKWVNIIGILWFLPLALTSQTLDDPLSEKKMRRDFEVFKEIRLKANSGLYRYRTKSQIDSIYDWADAAIGNAETYLHFYNIICRLTDFEGSLHNGTDLSDKAWESMKAEKTGYFPFPLKMVEGHLIMNSEQTSIPLGAKIISINGNTVSEILPNFYRYYTTDGANITGKSIGINRHFSRYYRLHYGVEDAFEVVFNALGTQRQQTTTLKSTGYSKYYENVEKRYSKPYDEVDYKDWKIDEMYTYKEVGSGTGLLTINSFAIGDSESEEHSKYVVFLDSTFQKVKRRNIQNLIVDVRHNGGGSDPNDLVTYSYLTQRDFSENSDAKISFEKIPFLKWIDFPIPVILRPFVVGKFNRELQADFPDKREDGFYQDGSSSDHKVRSPNENAFTGNIYLLIGPRVASAGSLFAAMVAGNQNTTVIGEETMGGYYGHNGHFPITYKLPKTKIETTFSIVNLEQDVPKKENQRYDRGIIPDYKVRQNFEDYLTHVDTQMDFTLELIQAQQ